MKEPWYKQPVNLVIVYSVLLTGSMMILLSVLIEHNFSISWREDDFSTILSSILLSVSFIIGIVRARKKKQH